MLRHLFFIILNVLLCGNAVHGQLAEDLKTAGKQVRLLDEKIILTDPSAALSDEQVVLINQLYVSLIEDKRMVNNSKNGDKSDAIQELMNEVNKTLNLEILTKRQRSAVFQYSILYESKE